MYLLLSLKCFWSLSGSLCKKPDQIHGHWKVRQLAMKICSFAYTLQNTSCCHQTKIVLLGLNEAIGDPQIGLETAFSIQLLTILTIICKLCVESVISHSVLIFFSYVWVSASLALLFEVSIGLTCAQVFAISELWNYSVFCSDIVEQS